MESDVVIKAQNLSVEYGNTLVLSEVSCEINKGEFIGILGRSGTGKTTFLNAIAGFIKPKGMMSVLGNVGFCFQTNNLFHWMTIAENISFALNGMKSAERNFLVSNFLKKIDLWDAANKYPSELSGGQIQRVAFARALAGKPSILLLDEPFSSLDVLTRDFMIDWVLDFIKDYSVTVVMVTHYIDEALIFSDRIFILKNGRIDQDFKVPISRPRTLDIRFTETFQKNKQFLLNKLKTDI